MLTLSQGGRVCRSRLSQQPVEQYSPGVNTIHADPRNSVQLFHFFLAEPAPQISVQIVTHTGTEKISVSGAAISAAGEDTLATLGYHPFNLLPSMVVPIAVNSQNMQPIQCIWVTLKLNNKQYQEELHFFPGMRGAIISWRQQESWEFYLPITPCQSKLNRVMV